MKYVLSVVFFALCFASDSGVGNLIQLMSVGALFIAAIFFANYQKNHKPDFVLIFLIPLLSMVMSLLRQDIDAGFYSMAVILCLFACYLTTTTVTVNDTVVSYVLGTGAAAILIATLFFPDLILALSVTTTDTGLFRFSPVGSHPNLIGHIYGATFVASVFLISKKKSFLMNSFFILIAVISLVFIVAASSRGGLLAALISLGIVYFSSRENRDFLFKSAIFKTSLVFVFFLLAYKSVSIFEYFNSMLELDSESRGAGSGLTGRTEGWPIVINYLFVETSLFLVGNGFRSWSFEKWGFHIDNGYINLIYEVGVFSCAYYFYALLRSIPRIKNPIRIRVCAKSALLLFIIFEGVVARYLFGVGNPASLLILLLVLSNHEEDYIS